MFKYSKIEITDVSSFWAAVLKPLRLELIKNGFTVNSADSNTHINVKIKDGLNVHWGYSHDRYSVSSKLSGGPCTGYDSAHADWRHQPGHSSDSNLITETNTVKDSLFAGPVFLHVLSRINHNGFYAYLQTSGHYYALCGDIPEIYDPASSYDLGPIISGSNKYTDILGGSHSYSECSGIVNLAT